VRPYGWGIQFVVKEVIFLGRPQGSPLPWVAVYSGRPQGSPLLLGECHRPTPKKEPTLIK